MPDKVRAGKCKKDDESEGEGRLIKPSYYLSFEEPIRVSASVRHINTVVVHRPVRLRFLNSVPP